MKEILEELARAIVHPTNDQVYYEYEEKSITTHWGIEHHLFILEKNKNSNEIKQIVFRQSKVESKENRMYIKIDFLEVIRKQFLLEVFRYGVFSAIESLKKFKESNDKTRSS